MTVISLHESEADFQRSVIDYAQVCGWRTAHFHDSRREVRRKDGTRLMIGDKTAAGFPDLVLCRGTRLLFVELKAEKGRVSSAQTDWLWALREVESDAAGRVLVKVWRPSSWPEIEATLGARG